MVKKIFRNSAFFLLCLCAFVVIISNIAFIFKFEISYFNTIFSVAFSIATLYLLTKRPKETALSAIMGILVLILSGILAESFFDTSWDGQGYHQETVYLLKNGWNPIYEDSHSVRMWVNFYQKGNELIQANIYYLTNKIETGKLINIIFPYIAFISVFSFLQTLNLRFVYRLLLSCTVVFNPVVFTQIFTFYLDGNWYLALVISLSSLLLYFETKKLIDLISFVLASVIFCSLKFSSIPIFIVFSLFGIIYYHLRNRKFFFMPLVSIFLLVAVCNVHPFFNNLQKNRHILHPFYGEQKVDIINQNIPVMLLNRNRVERTLISLFSHTSNDMNISIRNALKIPFTFTKDEFFINYDMRLGGFGFLFSAVLICVLLLLVFLLSIRGNFTSQNKKLIFILLAVTCSVLINPASWWSRLSPQIWLIPVVVIIFGFLSKSNISKTSAKLVLLILMFNLVLPFTISLMVLQRDNREMKNFINSVGNRTIKLDLSHQFGFQQYYLKFKERNIKYEIGKINEKGKLAPFTPDTYYEIK